MRLSRLCYAGYRGLARGLRVSGAKGGGALTLALAAFPLFRVALSDVLRCEGKSAALTGECPECEGESTALTGECPECEAGADGGCPVGEGRCAALTGECPECEAGAGGWPCTRP